MSPRGPSLALIAQSDGCVAFEACDAGETLGHYDRESKRQSEVPLPKGACQAFPFDGGWLVRVPQANSLIPTKAKLVRGKPAVFAEGESAIVTFFAAADGVAVARVASLEWWSHAGVLRWSMDCAETVAIITAQGRLIALARNGELHAIRTRDGVRDGALHLASPVAAEDWRLASIGGGLAVLALGDWLVWVDLATCTTVRRVRARDAVSAIVGDGTHVLAGLSNGEVQAFDTATGEPSATFEAEPGGVTALALGKTSFFSTGRALGVRAWPRSSLARATAAESPVTALTALGPLVAMGNAAGQLRIFESGAEVSTHALGEPVSHVHLPHHDFVVAVAGRLLHRLPRGENASGVPTSVRAARLSHAAPAGAKRTPDVSSASDLIEAMASGLREVAQTLALRSTPTAFAADGAYAFAGTEGGAVDVYDLNEAKYVTTYALSDTEITQITRLPGRLLVVGTGALDGRVFVVDVSESEVLHRLEPHDDAFGITCLASDPRGRIVASGADDGSIALIDPNRGRVLVRLRVRETPVSLAFDTDGRRLACAFADGTAGVFTLGASGMTLEERVRASVTQVAWGSGSSFVVGFADGRIETLAEPAATHAVTTRKHA